MIYTTLNRIRAHQPCAGGWAKLLASIDKTAPGDEPLSFAYIVKSNGLYDALWCCRAEPQHAKAWRLYAVWCARQVAHLNSNPRSHAAIDTAERYAHGEASETEVDAAIDAASAARDDAWAVKDTALAAWIAWVTAWAAWAAIVAARDDAWAVKAVALAAWIAARGNTWAAQTAEFLRIVESEK